MGSIPQQLTASVVTGAANCFRELFNHGQKLSTKSNVAQFTVTIGSVAVLVSTRRTCRVGLRTESLPNVEVGTQGFVPIGLVAAHQDQVHTAKQEARSNVHEGIPGLSAQGFVSTLSPNQWQVIELTCQPRNEVLYYLFHSFQPHHLCDAIVTPHIVLYSRETFLRLIELIDEGMPVQISLYCIHCRWEVVPWNRIGINHSRRLQPNAFCPTGNVGVIIHTNRR